MTRIYEEVQLDIPKERAWEIIADLGGVVNFHPFVTNSYYTTDKLEGEGAARICEFGPKQSISERAIEWNDGENFTLDISFVKGPKPPVNYVHGTIGVRESDKGSIVYLEIKYQTKFGPIGAIMDRMMLHPQYVKLVNGVMKGLRHYTDSGEIVNLDVLKRISLAASPAA